MTKDFEIVRLTAGDADFARRMAIEVFALEAVSREHLTAMLAMPHVIVLAARRGDDPLGGLVAYEFPGLADEKLAYLYDIEVLPSERRRGIGISLVHTLIDICRNDRVAEIWVGSDTSNVAACALWEATGAERGSEQYVEFSYELEE